MLKYAIKRLLTITRYWNKCKIDAKVVILGQCHFEGKNRISLGAYLKNVNLGFASNIGANSYITNVRIGRFSSIGDNVKFINAIHPLTPFVSTHPIFYRNSQSQDPSRKTLFNEYIVLDNGFSNEVGNDVWIGSNVLIKGGVRIGDGAVIAMGAVVTDDVLPYSIVGGVPAKFIRLRFNESQVNDLMNIEWWNKPVSWIYDNARFFQNISDFIEHVKQRG